MAPIVSISILVALALLFDFLNGFNDSANAVATLISSRAMTPRAALTIAAVSNFIGPLVFGVAVAETVGKDVVDPQHITIVVVLAALVSASLWNFVTWFFGIPSSSSHALVGGIVGAVVMESGLQGLRVEGLLVVASALFLSPIVGFGIGWLMMRVMLYLSRDATPKANIFFKVAQIPSAMALALGHGANDAQKTMGIITMGLVVLGYQSEFHVPLWVLLASASALAFGTFLGGWRIIRTLGAKFYRIRPIHSFSSQLTSALVILTASITGGPVSTTHVVSTSILGVGAAHRRSQVRWGVMVEILLAWLLTVPLTSVLSALIYSAIKLLM
jgi:PiT family inorganic phosphate transporter